MKMKIFTEFTFIWLLFCFSQFHSSNSYWIGFNDRENEGDWLWSDRSTSSYTNWADDAPNNGGYSCTSVGKSGKWHDGKCGDKLNVVCKKKGKIVYFVERRERRSSVLLLTRENNV